MHYILLLSSLMMIGAVVAKAADSKTELEALNREYIRSAVTSDVAWFDKNISADFVCSNGDGTQVDRAGFLKQTANPRGISNVELHDVNIRVLGDFALIHARTTFVGADGKPGSIRYTDAWARQNGRWVAVSAHITPIR
jgi:ketosteroid isomerase-like protein